MAKKDLTKPIDPIRPRKRNADGSISTEKTISFQADTDRGPRFLVAPTVIDGKEIAEEEAIDRVMRGEAEPIGIFESREEADRFADRRSRVIEAIRTLGDAKPPAEKR